MTAVWSSCPVIYSERSTTALRVRVTSQIPFPSVLTLPIPAFANPPNNICSNKTLLVPRVRLGGLCSILYPLCYSNMLKIVPIRPKIMPQICLLCSKYAHALFLEGANLYVQIIVLHCTEKSKLKQDGSSSTIELQHHGKFNINECTETAIPDL